MPWFAQRKGFTPREIEVGPRRNEQELSKTGGGARSISQGGGKNEKGKWLGYL